MRFGFCAGSYTARSSAIADEEAINLSVETAETQGSIAPSKAYGGSSANPMRSLLWTPGLKVFATLPGVPRGSVNANGRVFVVAADQLCEVASDGTYTARGSVVNDSKRASLEFSPTQVFIVSGGKAYCFTLATNALLDVTSQMADVPVMVKWSDTYFMVLNASGKWQFSDPLDGTVFNGIYVSTSSVFADKPISIEVNHRELWVFGSRHAQPYQDTGSTNIFDVIGGAMLEIGCGAANSVCKLDNSIFWLSEDERGARQVWRAQGYTPQRISTHAVEYDLSTYADVSGSVAYAYQDGGHLYYVLYIPGASWSWVYDVAEGMWHKRASWVDGKWGPHFSWNYVYAFGKHLVGDWNSSNLYELDMSYLDDSGVAIRRLRRSPTIQNEGQWLRHTQLIVDIETGYGPQPPLLDGNGKARAPQIMVRWSDDRGKTWSNEYTVDCGMAGEFKARAILRRLGRSRYRVYEVSMTDPVAWVIVDAYVEVE